MVGQGTPVRRVMSGIHPEAAEKDSVAEAIDHVLHEVQAARRDLRGASRVTREAPRDPPARASQDRSS